MLRCCPNYSKKFYIILWNVNQPEQSKFPLNYFIEGTQKQHYTIKATHSLTSFATESSWTKNKSQSKKATVSESKTETQLLQLLLVAFLAYKLAKKGCWEVIKNELPLSFYHPTSVC